MRCLLRPGAARCNTQRIKGILSQDLNWDYFLSRARSEGVAPLVYSNLSGIDYAQAEIPADIRKRLEAGYYTVAANNSRLYEKLGRILDFFKRSGIEAIVLKGMALAQTVYPDIALRPMYDIDILIHRQDFARVENGLRVMGYMNSPSYPEDFHKDNMMVDVHWELMNVTRVKSRGKSYRIGMQEVWQCARFVEIDGRTARVLSPEHCLMYLCLHLVLHHGLSGLIWLTDIARLIEHYKAQIDWDKFIDDCLRYKICKPVYYALCYVEKSLGQQLPQPVLRGLEPNRQGFIERKIFDLVLSGASLENIRFLFTFLTIESLTDRLRFLREISLPSPKALSARYNMPSAGRIPRCYLAHFRTILLSISKLLKQIAVI